VGGKRYRGSTNFFHIFLKKIGIALGTKGMEDSGLNNLGKRGTPLSEKAKAP